MAGKYDIADTDDPMTFATNLVAKFNKSLRINESPREVVGVKVLGESAVLHEHAWTKQNLVTVIRGGTNYDIMKCERCDVTGKRFGLSRSVIRDSQYRAKCYSHCETAIEQMKKNKDRATKKEADNGR